MIHLRYLLALAVLFSPYYSYSNWTYGTTGNAAANGSSWGMPDLFPEANNLSVNGVFYQYTPIKNTADDMKVHVQNEDAVNGGYIFRETDDWSGRQGGTPINKVIGVPNVPQKYWGKGSIDVEGTGSVIDTSVTYSYKFDDSCITALSDPSCPGYNEALLSTINKIPVAEAYDPSQEVKDTLEEKAELKDGEGTQQSSEGAEEQEIDLENLLSEIDNNALIAQAVAQNHLMKAMALGVNIKSYYSKKIAGGVYTETISLKDKDLPDNKRGARLGLAQQLKHEEMVSLQYGTVEEK